MGHEIYKKIYDIMCETEGLDKSIKVEMGRNSYNAVSEKDVLNVIKPLLKKHKIILYPSEVKSTERQDNFSTSKGESSRLLTTVHATFKMVDIETGDFAFIQTVGNGSDTQDKGTGKAFTYAYKALLQKTFMLFSGEDTDNTHSEKITEEQIKKLNAEQISNIEELLEQNPDKTLLGSMLKGYEVENISEIPSKAYSAIIKRLSNDVEV